MAEPLSLTSQAVLDACRQAFDCPGALPRGLAAALRVAADRVVPELGCPIYGLTPRENERQLVRGELLTVATELEAL